MTYVTKAIDRDLSDRPMMVLIVDDEQGPREAMRMILKDRCAVLTARNEEEALSRLNDVHLDIDIVALDIRLGGEDGISLLQTIKKTAPNVEVFLVTGFPSVDTAVRAMRFGAYDYIVKPFDKNVVLEVVEKGIRRQGQSLFEQRMWVREHRPNESSA